MTAKRENEPTLDVIEYRRKGHKIDHPWKVLRTDGCQNMVDSLNKHFRGEEYRLVKYRRVSR